MEMRGERFLVFPEEECIGDGDAQCLHSTGMECVPSDCAAVGKECLERTADEVQVDGKDGMERELRVPRPRIGATGVGLYEQGIDRKMAVHEHRGFSFVRQH